MSLATTDPFATSAGPDKTAVRHRRVASMRVREVRDRLTSTTGTRPAFDYELLRQFAQNRLSGSIAIVLLVAMVGTLSGVWGDALFAGIWAFAVLLIHAVMVAVCSRFLGEPPSAV